MSFQISLSDTSSEIVREYREGIILSGPYEVGLKHFVFWNNIFNITQNNNVLILVDPQNDSKYEVSIAPGYYDVSDIITAFDELEMIRKSNTVMGLTTHTLKVKIKSHWRVDFSSPRSIGKVLGFSSKRIIQPDKQETSDAPPIIFSINTVRIHCNLIRTNVDNLQRNTNILYDFPLDFDKIGSKVIKEPNPICHFRLNTSTIYELVIRITDQNNSLLSFRGEELGLTLNFRPAVL